MSLMLINTIISVFMTGVIWIIQLVHYPSFRFVDEQLWQESHRHHVSRISWVVAPMMILELGFRLWWIITDFHTVSVMLGILLLVIWLSTFLIQVPLHNKLESHKSMERIDTLVRSNWLRTLAWTLSSVILLIGYTLNL